MKKIILTICLLFVTSNAFAWGALEQGILWGIGGTLVGQHIIRQNQPQTVYVQPAYPQHPQGYYVPAPYYNRHTYRPMYKAVDIWIPECGCYRTVLVQIN